MKLPDSDFHQNLLNLLTKAKTKTTETIKTEPINVPEID